MVTKLESCPFCGSTNTEIRHWDTHSSYGACRDCGCEMPNCPSVADARKAWNTRAKDGHNGKPD